MSHIKAKDQRRVLEKTRGQEQLLGRADHIIKSGQPTKRLGRVGLPILQMLDLNQAGGKSLVPVRLLVMQCPALQKHRAVVHGMLQATEGPSKVPLHRGSRAQIPNHHGTKIDSRSNHASTSLRKAGGKKHASTSLRKAGGKKRIKQKKVTHK